MVSIHLDIYRDVFTEKSSTGLLLVEKEFVCDSLEDRIRAPGVKVPGATAIAPGLYPLLWTYSNRFKRFMPLIANVPNFSGVRLHWGNDRDDTEGCPLVGTAREADRVLNSVAAYKVLESILKPHFEKGGTGTIQIVNVNPPEELLRA